MATLRSKDEAKRSREAKSQKTRGKNVVLFVYLPNHLLSLFSRVARYCNVPVKYLQQVDRSFMAYPNPTADFVNVRFQLNGIEDDVELNVSDMLGRMVHSEAIPNFTGQYNGQINLNNQAEGVYILQLQVGNERLHRKIVLRK